VVQERGFYSLRDNDHIESRFTRNKISEQKWRRAKRVASWLVLVPFVTSVSVVDSVALDKATAKSDIDFFITVQSGRLWLTRLLVTGLTQILRYRRHGSHVADRVCLSFYATNQALELAAIAIPQGDLYLADWIFALGNLWCMPGFDVQQALIKRNPWAATLFPQRRISKLAARRCVPARYARLARYWQRLLEKMLSARLGVYLEKKARRFQSSWMKKTIPTELKTPTAHILINDQMLKFHEQDRRLWLREKTLATFAALKAGRRQELNDDVPYKTPTGLTIQPVGATTIPS